MGKYYPIGARGAVPERRRLGGSSDEPQISDTARVRGNVRAGPGVRIGRYCIVEGDIAIGDRTRIDDHCVLRGRATIGADNWIYPFCTVGTGPQHSGHPEDPRSDPAAAAGADREIVIGSNNIMRGYASINLPSVAGRTTVGSNCHLLAYSHVAHDCNVRDGAILSAGAILGGHTEVGAGAHLGLGTMVHPHTRIGRLAMVGLRGAVTRDVLPFALINRERFTRINTVGMERAGMTGEQMAEVKQAYDAMAAGKGLEGGGLAEEIRGFAAASERGYYPPRFE